MCTTFAFQKNYHSLKPVLLPHFTERYHNLDSHITAMKRSSEHGDILEVCVIAYMMKTPVHIVQKMSNNCYKLTQTIPSSTFALFCDNEPLFLLYSPEVNNNEGKTIQSGHYDLLQKKTYTPSVNQWSGDAPAVCEQTAKEYGSLVDIIHSISPVMRRQNSLVDGNTSQIVPDPVLENHIKLCQSDQTVKTTMYG